LELESKPIDEVHEIISKALGRLVDKGTDCVLLGCAGMAEMRSICEAVVEGIGCSVSERVGEGEVGDC
jgi:dihydropyrimidinase